MANAIAGRRLHNQYLTRALRGGAADVVARLGAVQAQEYAAARWALALRMREGTTDAAITQAVDEGRILRTHLLRPTWHFVTPADIGWMLRLTAPRVLRVMSSYFRQLEIDDEMCVRAAGIFERAVRDRTWLTRAELGARLARAGISATGTRLGMLAMYAELQGVICSGPYRGKQSTYGLLAERAPQAVRLQSDEALGELVRRFFTSHAPATIRDFVWWSGLTTPQAKRGLEIVGAKPETAADGMTYWSVAGLRSGRTADTGVHLLPIYDEYVVAYRDREAVPHTTAATVQDRPKVIFQHAVVIDGQVAGTWRTPRKGSRVAVEVYPLRTLTRAEREGLASAGARYGRFLNADIPLRVIQ